MTRPTSLRPPIAPQPLSKRRPPTTALLICACWLWTLACRDESPDRKNASDPAKTQEKSDAKDEPTATTPPPPPAAPPRAAPTQPVTPKTPPQLVACGTRDFYRVAEDALQVFETAKVVPPPAIRGSAVARQVDEHELLNPSSVISFEGGALAIGQNEVVSYQGKQAMRHPPLGVSAPLTAWPDRAAGSVWVHEEGASRVNRYTLPTKPKGAPTKTDDATAVPSKGTGGAKTTPDKAQTPIDPGATEELPGFDGRAFTVMANGKPFYSSASGLQEPGPISSPETPPNLPASEHLLLAAASPTQVWTSDENGQLALWNNVRSDKPARTWPIPGAIIDVAKRGNTLVVLSVQLTSDTYRPTLTVLTRDAQVAQLQVAPSPASLGAPELDLCVLPDRPWVVVGGEQWLQLLEWTSPRLLAEW